MNRREALKRVAFLLGGAISAPLVKAALSGYQLPPERGFGPRYTPRTLSAQQDELVATIAELIIPATDTPGAKAARVNEFIDLMLTEWYPPKDRDRFLAGLDELEAQFRQKHGKRFPEGTPEQQTEFLAALDREAVAARRAKVKDLPFFAMMKELALVGYYTSTIGMTEELQFQPATDKYEGCIPLDRVGRAWAEFS
jgi:hypothetical protein